MVEKKEEEEREKMALENIREWILDENKIVSFKWLSMTLSIHVNESKHILDKFVKQNKGKPDCQLSVVHCISGFIEKDGSQVFKVELVADELLEEVEASFIPPVSHHVYSVQKSSAKNLSNLYIADYDLIKQNISSSNKFSAIHCPSAKLRKPSDSVQTSRTEEEDCVITLPPVQNMSEKSKLNSASKGVSSFFAKQAQKTSSAISKSSDGLKQDSSCHSSDTNSNLPLISDKNFNSSDSKPKIRPAPVSNGKSANKVSTKVQLKEKQGQRKRIRIADLSSSEEEEEEDPLAENSTEMDLDVIDPSENLSIPALSTEGLHQSVTPATDANYKRSERKLVSKTYINDDGFMVTEKVWETSEVMDEPPPPPPPPPAEKLTIEQPPPTKKPVIPPQSSGATKKKATQAKGNNKQASLMKFFNKQ